MNRRNALAVIVGSIATFFGFKKKTEAKSDNSLKVRYKEDGTAVFFIDLPSKEAECFIRNLSNSLYEGKIKSYSMWHYEKSLYRIEWICL